MVKQCTTCGGSMAHYPIIPDTYCTKHSNWIDKCNSEECFSTKLAKQSQDGYFICSTDGFIVEAVRTLIPTSIIPNDHESYTDAHTTDVKRNARQILSMWSENGALEPAEIDHLMKPETRGAPAIEFVLNRGRANDAAKEVVQQAQTQRATAAKSEELIPYKHKNYDSKTNNWKADEKIKERADKELTTPSHLVAVERTREHLETIKGPALSLIEQMPEHKRFETVKSLADSPLQEMNENLYKPLRESMGLSGDQFEIAASIQKEAMWYFLKPRWILRRKASAIIRNKVRSVVSPVMSRHTK